MSYDIDMSYKTSFTWQNPASEVNQVHGRVDLEIYRDRCGNVSGCKHIQSYPQYISLGISSHTVNKLHSHMDQGST